MTESPEIFCDTCVLINHLNQVWEDDRTSEFFESENTDPVISETVESEFEDLIDRRRGLYQDFAKHIAKGGDVSEYSPSGSFKNDYGHVRTLQETLLEYEEPEHAARRLRKFGRRFDSNADHIIEELISEIVFASPPLSLTFALRDIIDNSNDCDVVADGADWAAQGGSGFLVTLDGQDILDIEHRINEAIQEEMGEEGILEITPPDSDQVA